MVVSLRKDLVDDIGLRAAYLLTILREKISSGEFKIVVVGGVQYHEVGGDELANLAGVRSRQSAVAVAKSLIDKGYVSKYAEPATKTCYNITEAGYQALS